MNSIICTLEEILSDTSAEEMTKEQARKCLFDCGIIDENMTIKKEFRKYVTPKDQTNGDWKV